MNQFDYSFQQSRKYQVFSRNLVTLQLSSHQKFDNEFKEYVALTSQVNQSLLPVSTISIFKYSQRILLNPLQTFLCISIRFSIALHKIIFLFKFTYTNTQILYNLLSNLFRCYKKTFTINFPQDQLEFSEIITKVDLYSLLNHLLLRKDFI